MATPERVAAVRYAVMSYARAISKAVKRLNSARQDPEAGPPAQPVPSWHPNQLRHARATEIRTKYGLEAAQVALGHSRADVTQFYAERNLALAVKVAAATG